MFDNSVGIWLFDEASASFSAISFKNIYRFKMIFWLCHLVCLWHSKYSYEQLHVDLALQPAGGEACSISSSSCWNGQEVFMNEGSGEPVIRLCSWQHGDMLGEIRCIWRPVKNTTIQPTAHSDSQLRARGILNTLQPVIFLHLCFLSAV